MRDWSPLIFISLFPVYFIGMWCFVLWFLSRTGGWATIAETYRAAARPEGLHYRGQSLRLQSFANYSSCMNVTLSLQGIHMIPLAIFRFGHQPLLIPWSCVGPLEEKTFLFFKVYLLPMEATGKKMRLSVPASAREWLAANRP